MSGDFIKRRFEAGKTITLSNMFTDVSEYLEEYLPEGRERSLALTRLDESRMWAKEAINE